MKYEQILKHDEMQAELEINRARILAEVESGKFEEMIEVIGKETMVALANAGPEAQVLLLLSNFRPNYLKDQDYRDTYLQMETTPSTYSVELRD